MLHEISLLVFKSNTEDFFADCYFSEPSKLLLEGLPTSSRYSQRVTAFCGDPCVCRWQAVAFLISRTPLPASLYDLRCSVENRFLGALPSVLVLSLSPPLREVTECLLFIVFDL
ncbi:hypothetical protein GEMRC1_011493 [Eukaryota sp. GEM-RC1]